MTASEVNMILRKGIFMLAAVSFTHYCFFQRHGDSARGEEVNTRPEFKMAISLR